MVNRFFLHRRRQTKRIAGNPLEPHTPYLGDTAGATPPYTYSGLYGSTPYNLPYFPRPSFSKALMNPGALFDIFSYTLNNPFSVPSFGPFNHPSQGTSYPTDTCSITLPFPMTFFNYSYYYNPPGAIAQYNAAQISLAELNQSYPQFGDSSTPVKFSKPVFELSASLSSYGSSLTTYPDMAHYLVTDGAFFYARTSNFFNVTSPTPTFSGDSFVLFNIPPADAPFGYIYKVKSAGQGVTSNGIWQVAFLVQYLAFSQIPYKYIPANPVMSVVNFQTPAPVFQKEYLIYATGGNTGGFPEITNNGQFFETRSSGFNLTKVDYDKTHGYPSCFLENYFCVLVQNNILAYSLADGSYKELGPYNVGSGSFGNVWLQDYYQDQPHRITFQGNGQVMFVVFINNVNELEVIIYDKDANVTKAFKEPIKGDTGSYGFGIVRSPLICALNQIMVFSYKFVNGYTHINLVKFDIIPNAPVLEPYNYSNATIIQSAMNAVSTQIDSSQPPLYQPVPPAAAENFFLFHTAKNEVFVKGKNNSPATIIKFP